MTAVAGKSAYQEDLADARAELAELRTTGAPPRGCVAEANLIGQRVMPKISNQR